MVGMILVEVLASPFFYSTRLLEAYQVAETMPLPPPSTIGGAFAYSYAIWKGIDFRESLKIFAENAWYYVIPESDIILSSIILRRIRLLQLKEALIRSRRDRERFIERLPEDVAEILKKRENIINKLKTRHDFLRLLRDLNLEYYWTYYTKTFFDAMIRRYAFTNSIYIAGLIQKINEKFPLGFTRLGDTESYLAIKKINFIKEFKLDRVANGYIETPAYALISYKDKNLVLPVENKEGWPIIFMTEPKYLLDRNKTNKVPMILPLVKRVKRVNNKEIETYVPKPLKLKIISEIYVLKYYSNILKKEVKVIIPKDIIRGI